MARTCSICLKDHAALWWAVIPVAGWLVEVCPGCYDEHVEREPPQVEDPEEEGHEERSARTAA